jgi:hypothetical protein
VSAPPRVEKRYSYSGDLTVTVRGAKGCAAPPGASAAGALTGATGAGAVAAGRAGGVSTGGGKR